MTPDPLPASESALETLQICRPTARYLDSYCDVCRESYFHVHDTYILHNPALEQQWRSTIFDDYARQERGETLPPGFVPSITWWLIAQNRCLGAINLRLYLSPQLAEFGGHAGIFIRPSERKRGWATRVLPLLLQKAEQCSISPLLLTCTAANTASLHTLQSIPCERHEEAIVTLNQVPTPIHRFWFRVPNAE